MHIVLFSKSKSTRFRCNSQPKVAASPSVDGCFQRAKVQDLDAIHNSSDSMVSGIGVVFKEQKYKI